MQPFKKLADMGLRTKLLLVYLSLSTILFTSGGLGALIFAKKAIKTSIENDLHNATRAIVNLVETATQASITNYLRAVAEHNLEIARLIHQQSLDGQLNEAQARSRIRALLLGQTIGSTGYIYCLDSKGVIAVHPNPGVEGDDLTEHEFIREQLRLKTGYIEYDWQNPGEKAPRPKALYMTYFEPYDWIISVTSYRDEFLQILPIEEIRSSVRDLKFGYSGYVYVADRKGNIIIHPELEGKNFYRLPAKDIEFFEKMFARRDGHITYWWKNPGDLRPREKLAFFGYIQELDWIVGSSGYMDEIYAPIRTARNTTIAFILISVLLSALLTLFVSDSITRRLRRLLTIIAKGEQGDLTVRAAPGSEDEVGHLERAFNAFLERLQSYHGDLAAEIDKHRATADSLQKANDFNELILSTVDALVIVIAPDGRIVLFNRACQKCSGYAAHEIEGQNLFTKLVPGAEKEKLRIRLDELVRKKQGHRHANRWVTKDGQQRLIQWSNAVTTGTDGEVEFIVGAGLDITEQRATEKALRKSEALFEAVFNQTYQFIGVLSPDGIVRSINQTALDFIGVKKEDITGQKFWETPFWQDTGDIRGKLKDAIAAACLGQFKRMEVVHIRADNQRRSVDFSLKPVMNGSGKATMLIAEGRDITKQKAMESRLQQAQKMDAVGTLAGGIAHDFNNNLQAISGYAQLLLMDEERSSRQKEMLTIINNTCSHASELTRQLLTFSREIESRLEALDLNAELRNVVKLLERTLPRMIRIETRLTEDLFAIRADRVQFEQVVMNLGINAGHAMPDGGTLTIETSNVDLDDDYCREHVGMVPGTYAMLSVTDTGIGMDAETREHIFEPFFTTRETGRGTGLGLAMVYGIVKNHKGIIDCESEPGKGTAFRIYFPAAAEEGTAEKPSGKAIPHPQGNESILLVDDDQAVREVGREILKRFGYRVTEAEDGESGLRRYRELGDKIDLILLDLNMPGMGGRRCLEKLREASAVVPVLITSGDAPKGEAKATLDELAQGVVSKPYEIGSLLTMVRETLDRKTSPSFIEN